MVESDDGEETGPQKSFRITAEGREELAAWFRTPSGGDVPPRDELVIKVLVALRVPGVDVPEILQAHRRHLVRTMQRYTRLKEDAAPDEVGLLLVADAELFRIESVIRWLDAAEARLARHPRPVPAPPAPATRPSRADVRAER